MHYRNVSVGLKYNKTSDVCQCGGGMQDVRAVAECHEHISLIPELQMLSRLDVRD